ncbi:Glucokinase regulatory protein [Liparis tanakae]|uniref:Glucokinase regulatory protein n=1 Tax=Liparis tanakae TaxID=230148 RepID=A0A4Z2G486_9TELE|nr:Glucokinase regulatory protein [Liparis tanakae]
MAALDKWESPDYEPSLPVSEKSNPLTRDLDRASANRIVRMLQACDAQMFQEETGGTYQRLLSEQVAETLAEVAKKVEHILKDPRDSLVVLSGCGTSGRMAFLIASAFNRALRDLDRSPVYSYLIAGGDKALLSSQEAPEDDPELGVLSLKKVRAVLESVCEGQKRVLFIGISCGLSAPFVAGQLDFCLQHPEVFTPVLVGFNPPHQARDERIPGCSFTFLGVVRRMQARARRQEAFLVTPAVGPEAVSGSSRMKGGSATKILLEVALSAAHGAAFARTPVTPSTSKLLPSSSVTLLSPPPAAGCACTVAGAASFLSCSILRRSNSIATGASDASGFGLKGRASIFLRTQASQGQYSSSLRWSLNSPGVSSSLRHSAVINDCFFMT